MRVVLPGATTCENVHATNGTPPYSAPDSSECGSMEEGWSAIRMRSDVKGSLWLRWDEVVENEW